MNIQRKVNMEKLAADLLAVVNNHQPGRRFNINHVWEEHGKKMVSTMSVSSGTNIIVRGVCEISFTFFDQEVTYSNLLFYMRSKRPPEVVHAFQMWMTEKLMNLFIDRSRELIFSSTYGFNDERLYAMAE